MAHQMLLTWNPTKNTNAKTGLFRPITGNSREDRTLEEDLAAWHLYFLFFKNYLKSIIRKFQYTEIILTSQLDIPLF